MFGLRQERSSVCTAGLIISHYSSYPSDPFNVLGVCLRHTTPFLHVHACLRKLETHSMLSCGGEARLPQVGCRCNSDVWALPGLSQRWLERPIKHPRYRGGTADAALMHFTADAWRSGWVMCANAVELIVNRDFVCPWSFLGDPLTRWTAFITDANKINYVFFLISSFRCGQRCMLPHHLCNLKGQHTQIINHSFFHHCYSKPVWQRYFKEHLPHWQIIFFYITQKRVIIHFWKTWK